MKTYNVLHIVTFVFSAGNIGDHFSIKLKSGHLSLEKALDYENRTHFNLTIMVEDGIFNVCCSLMFYI